VISFKSSSIFNFSLKEDGTDVVFVSPLLIFSLILCILSTVVGLLEFALPNEDNLKLITAVREGREKDRWGGNGSNTTRETMLLRRNLSGAIG